MKINDVRRAAYAMPLTNPAFPRGPYRFFDREYLIVTYRTDADALRAVVPEPLEVIEPIVKYEFIRKPDLTGFGDYTESGAGDSRALPRSRRRVVHSMYLDDDAAIVGGRELWGFPKKLAQPKITHEGEVIVGTLHYGKVLCATATIGYKQRPADRASVLAAMQQPNFLLKVIPHVDGGPRICELVRYHLEEIKIKGSLARTGRSAALSTRRGRCRSLACA